MSLTEKIILAALENPPKTEEAFNVLKRSLMAGENPEINLPDKTELLVAYHDLVKNNKILPNEHLERMLMRRAVRSLSGVAVITSLIKPYPCPGQCVYCPFDERMPKSYLSEEPAIYEMYCRTFLPKHFFARPPTSVIVLVLQDPEHPHHLQVERLR
jgi:elongator complex protein 3